MTDWKKISVIVTLVVLLLSSGFGVAAWIFNKGGQSASLTKNVGMIPEIAEDLRAHKERDNTRAAIDSMRNIQFLNALNGLASTVNDLNETVKENNRLIQYSKFNNRK